MGFARVDEDLRQLGSRVDAQGAELSQRRAAMQRLMVQLIGALILMVLATMLSVILTQA